MDLSNFHYDLPAELIAQRPLEQRDASRMLILDRGVQAWQDSEFRLFPEALRGDELIVVNDARVIPARLLGRRIGVRAQKPGSRNRAAGEFLSSEIEVLLTRKISGRAGSGVEEVEQEWEGLVRPGRKMQSGERVAFGDGELTAEVIGRGDYGLRRLRLTARGDVQQAIEKLGHVPLPPYIARKDEAQDRERYQTIFARQPGAVAAPTAGLHFSPAIIEQIKKRGVQIASVTLNVGLGTFQPIHSEQIQRHAMHAEHYDIPEATVAAIRQARRENRPILAIGTTVVRALEDAAAKAAAGREDRPAEALLEPGPAEASLFITPGFPFRVIDQLLTNFHLSESTLLVLVSAFAGREFILRAYRHAVEGRYRFYSYGDCMLVR